MLKHVRSVIGWSCLLSLGLASAAQAEVQDRVIAMQGSPAAQYALIVEAATDMCREAADQGEVFDVRRCVKVVVAETISEINQPQLLQYAQTRKAQAAL